MSGRCDDPGYAGAVDRLLQPGAAGLAPLTAVRDWYPGTLVKLNPEREAVITLENVQNRTA